MYNRFLLIEYGWYYPYGGISDVVDSVNEYKDALNWFDYKVSKCSKDASYSFEVFDCEKRAIILNYSSES